MSMIYLPDNVARRLKETATRQRRGMGSTVEIMLDFEDNRFFQEQEMKKKIKESEVKK